MGLYDEKYGTSWTSLNRDEATERAYALGVAESLGEYDREEFEAVHEEMDTAYTKSIVELAFREGKNEGREAAPANADEEQVWDELVEGETVSVDEGDLPTGGRDGLPEAVDKFEALEKPDPDEIDATDRPDFLDK
ncbi:hypothetical protein C475_05430 [Halosimplex carlsbadense 2-9-1]|uniref:Uncharacterized protein n=1 Tax=Halosimplex carlsbadense 2-9-1 TaxID=797114 RepID=M0CYB5_9EURY|nr:hypothetical protein [Halosimplex carlsbadense]ELZ28221.1 hypothetical protein C475_05430 [Halosimplex carlsbadense 2-9-1]